MVQHHYEFPIVTNSNYDYQLKREKPCLAKWGKIESSVLCNGTQSSANDIPTGHLMNHHGELHNGSQATDAQLCC